ncbi:MAG: hypothetical protein ABI700_06495 [Chloroflexota bacterium]
MRIRRTTAILLVFAVVFVAANLVALPFANFGSYSTLWAQVYGNSEPQIPTCAPGSSDFSPLSDETTIADAFPPPTSDAVQVAVYVTGCFGLNTVPLSAFNVEGLTCDNVVAYRLEQNGHRQLWPISCDAAGTSLLIPGTGERGHIQLFKIADPSTAPTGVELVHGA